MNSDAPMTSPLVTIAIPDLAGPHARAATLAALERHTPEPHQIILLTEKSAAAYPGRALAVPAPFSAPAALNRLLAACTTPYLLLIESGAIVTTGWLSRLLAPLDDPAIGLSGPSTNWCWNEQGLLPRGAGQGWTPERIDAYAAEIAARHGDATHPLDTLHSLADFCYLFKRDLAEALGGFDEAYGAGPCWEIDFNTRAARAGFGCVWVLGAYIHRPPPLAWRAQTERRLFTANKHRYQDRFCGLRLRGEKATYEPHCRGDACEHFGPADRIQIRLMATDDRRPTTGDRRPTIRNAVSQLPTPNSQLPTPNLVTCIMPTRNRADFVLQSIAYFQRQTYADRELIVVDDGADDLAQRLPADPRIRHLRAPSGMSIGAKRNLACEHARGTIIAQWDDDDWYGPARLETQIAPLLAGEASITGLTTGAIFDLPRWEFWRCDQALHRRLFCEDIHGGTLVYRRAVWEHDARYPDRSLAEDALFLRQAIRRGVRLRRIPGEDLFVYLRHATNSWAFQCGQYLDPGGWQRIPEPPLPPADRAFYATHSPAAPANDQRPTTNDQRPTTNDEHPIMDNDSQRNLPTPNPQPPTPNSQLPTPNLVSCIMPTYNRRAFVPRAIDYFLRQDYESKELIVLDDGDDPVADLMPDDPRVRYVRLDRRLSLGAKRNRCVELAHSDLILHWDDDDWHAPQRITLQCEALRAAGAEICGLRQMLFFEPAARAAWLYSYPPQARPWLAGGSLLYTRALWRRAPFPNVHTGEDTRFVWEHNLSHAAIIADYSWYVARIHPANTSPKQRAGACWRRWPGDLHSVLGDDYDAFCCEQDKDGKIILHNNALAQQ